MFKKLSLFTMMFTLIVSLTGCGVADVSKKPEKFKIIEISADSYGVSLILLDELNNRITKKTIYDDYKFNADFKIKNKEDLIGKYFYGDVYSWSKIDTMIKSE